MTAPVRLLDDPNTSTGLQADLTAWQQHEVPFQLEASLAQFQARLESGAWEADLEPGPAEPVEPSGVVPKGSADVVAGQSAGKLGVSKLGAGKLLGVLVVGAGVGIGALQLASTDDPSATTPRAQDVDEAETRGAPERAAATETEPSTIAGAPEAEPDVASPALTEAPPPPRAAPRQRRASQTAGQPAPLEPRADVPRRDAAERDAVEHDAMESAGAPGDGARLEQDTPSPEVAPQQPSSDALQRELAQLGEVRRTLTQDPRRALELANRGHVEFQGGSLYQEREALALRALHALGARDALESRGRAFLLRYPKSSFAREVERMLTK